MGTSIHKATRGVPAESHHDSREFPAETPPSLPNSQNEPWETQAGWTYYGHGEWVQVDTQEENTEPELTLDKNPEWFQLWLNNNDSDILLHNTVIARGYPNRWGARIPVESRWNTERFAQLLQD